MTWGQSGYLLFRECPTPGPQRRIPASQPLTPDPEEGLGFQVNACSPPSGALVPAHVGSPPVCPAASAVPQSAGSGHVVGGHWMFVAKRIN